MKNSKIQLTTMLLILLSLFISVHAAPLIPKNTPSIQELIEKAAPGDTILIEPGTYYEDNILINKPLYLKGAGYDNTIIIATTSTEVVIKITSNNVRIEGLTIMNGQAGIMIKNARNVMIRRNKIIRNKEGIYLWNSHNNKIIGNILFQNNYSSICLWYSNFNLIFNNILNGTDTTNSTGISYGIDIWSGNNNQIIANTMINNRRDIYVSIAKNNTFYRNNIMTPTFRVFIDRSECLWNCTEEGNYWHGYSSIDNDNDGIADNPLYLDNLVVDNYPLMHPYKVGDANHDGEINEYDLHTVAERFGSFRTQERYKDSADIWPDGIIDIRDISIIARSSSQN